MKPFLLIAGVFAIFAVICGAFGAHGLKEHLTPEQLDSWRTGVRYQMWHALALIAIAQLGSGNLLRGTGWCFVAGTVLFSGSIYLLSAREVIGLTSYTWLGPITPLGGLLLIIGWGLFTVAMVKRKVGSA